MIPRLCILLLYVPEGIFIYIYIIRGGQQLNHTLNPNQFELICTKQVMFYLETCILILYIYHIHPQGPTCPNKKIIVLAHRPLFAPAPSFVPLRVRHRRTFMVRFCTKRTW